MSGMQELLYNLGLISLTVTFFYLVFWFDRRNKPSDFHLVRNRLQQITHPHLIIKGHGDYYLEYILDDQQIVEYFVSISDYRKNLEYMKQSPSTKILDHGVLPYRAWEKWPSK
nr:hypothetical protein [Acinetobacter lwoffii]